MVSWLSINFDLPAESEIPRIEFLPQGALEARRHRGAVQEQNTMTSAPLDSSAPSIGQDGSTVALYDNTLRTIYLAEPWRGDTPAETSILVHELVHHLQDAAGMTFECPQAREKVAYEAQERWLVLSDRSLFQDFEIDPLTLLLRTECYY